MTAVAAIPAGAAKFRQGTQRGLELRMETRLLRTEEAATVLHEDHRDITVDIVLLVFFITFLLNKRLTRCIVQ